MSNQEGFRHMKEDGHRDQVERVRVELCGDLNFHIHLHPGNEVPTWAREVLQKLGLILENLENIMASQAQVKEKLDALVLDVADETTQIAGIEQVLDNLAALIKALQDQVAAADVPQAIVDQVDALAGAVSGNKQRIIDDIKKNTPSA